MLAAHRPTYGQQCCSCAITRPHDAVSAWILLVARLVCVRACSATGGARKISVLPIRGWHAAAKAVRGGSLGLPVAAHSCPDQACGLPARRRSLRVRGRERPEVRRDGL